MRVLNVKLAKGVILHTGLGTQYTSEKCQEVISKKRIIHAFRCNGNPCDNVCIEFSNSILKEGRS